MRFFLNNLTMNHLAPSTWTAGNMWLTNNLWTIFCGESPVGLDGLAKNSKQTQGIHMFVMFKQRFQPLSWKLHSVSPWFSHQQIPRIFPAFSCGFPSIFPRFSHGFPPFDVRFIMFWHRFSRQTFRPHLLPRVVLRSPRCQRRSASRILQGTSMATAEHLGIRRAPGPARKKGQLWNLMGILMGIWGRFNEKTGVWWEMS